MTNTVSFNGKQYPVEKILALATQAAKDVYSLDKFQELANLDEAIVSEKTKQLIITPFEGKTVVLVKPSDLEQQIKTGKIQIAFYSKFLMKKLNTENVIIDTRPIDTRPRFERNDRRDNFRSERRDNRYEDRQDNRFDDRTSDRPTRNTRAPQKPRLFQSNDSRSFSNNRYRSDT